MSRETFAKNAPALDGSRAAAQNGQGPKNPGPTAQKGRTQDGTGAIREIDLGRDTADTEKQAETLAEKQKGRPHMENALQLGKSIPETILRLSGPAILEQFLICLASLVDTAMVGSIGAAATASVAINISSVWLINGCITALSVGSSFLVSHSVGEKDPVKTESAVRQSITASLVLGTLLTTTVLAIHRILPRILGAGPDVLPGAQTYMGIIGLGLIGQTLGVVLSAVLRSAGDTKTPMAANLAANLLNVIGNFFLIYPARQVTLPFGGGPSLAAAGSPVLLSAGGPALSATGGPVLSAAGSSALSASGGPMLLSAGGPALSAAGGPQITLWGAGLGIKGAAIATSLSQYALAAMLLYAICHVPTPAKICLRGDYRFRRRTLRSLFHIGIPVLLERVTLCLGQIALTAMISVLGTVPLAAHYLTSQTESLLYLPAYGFAYTGTTLIGQSLGAKDKKLAARFAKDICIISTVVILAACVPVYLFAGEIIRLFSNDAQVAQLGTLTIKIAAATEIFFSFFIVACGICRGAGDVKFPLAVSLIGMWGLRIGLVWLVTRVLLWGVAGVWIAIAVDCFVRSCLFLWRLLSGRWMDAA